MKFLAECILPVIALIFMYLAIIAMWPAPIDFNPTENDGND